MSASAAAIRRILSACALDREKLAAAAAHASRITGAASAKRSVLALPVGRRPSVESSVSTSRSSSSMRGIVSDRRSGRSPQVIAASTVTPFDSRTAAIPRRSSGARCETREYRCSSWALEPPAIGLYVHSKVRANSNSPARMMAIDAPCMLSASHATAATSELRGRLAASNASASGGVNTRSTLNPASVRGRVSATARGSRGETGSESPQAITRARRGNPLARRTARRVVLSAVS